MAAAFGVAVAVLLLCDSLLFWAVLKHVAMKLGLYGSSEIGG